MHRAFVPELSELASEWELPGDEARHLVAVCRIRLNEKVELFNGAGLSIQASVVHIRKNGCRVAIETYRRTQKPINSLVLASAFPKGDRVGILIEKATELGVERFVPLETARSVVSPGDRKLEKLRRTVVEACKQCGRDWLLDIEPVCRFTDFVNRTSVPTALFHTSGAIDPHGPIAHWKTAIIGPEGGWADDELQLARDHSIQIVRLPGHVLRIETAGIAVAALAAFQPLSLPTT